MKEMDEKSRKWEIAAFVAALFVLTTPFIWLAKHRAEQLVPDSGKTEKYRFVGSATCKSCHEQIYAKWLDSDHDKAMDIANSQTVLGDFNNASYTDPHNGITSRFFQRNGEFLVETEGPEETLEEFTISYVFGHYPLQQYLIPFPGGRLQCLNIAWNSRENHWYRLPPYDVKNSQDWLHWTRGGQTWNGMCAECHSTRVEKNYNPEKDSYDTRWFEIDVGCEACHGPGSRHVQWGKQPVFSRAPIANGGFTTPASTSNNKGQVTMCAPCHSRRFQLGDNNHQNTRLMDLLVPQRLEGELYYPDGQILEEDYVWGSFVQSKMYQHGVRCSDCHDVHSLKTHQPDNRLCLQCHKEKIYNTPSHHFHKMVVDDKPSEGASCVRCHMPAKMYMGADLRPDHSLRIPRPDLSEKHGTPNSCATSGCHPEKPVSWLVDAYRQWYGKKQKPHYGEILAAGRAGNPDAEKDLIELAGDHLYPAIVRASALALLREYPSKKSHQILTKSLDDEESLIRYTAIRSLEFYSSASRLQKLAPLLYDPIKAVRMEAAVMLSRLPEKDLRKDDRETFRKVLSEYREAMRYNSDFAPQRFNLANLALNRGNKSEAIRLFQEAISIDDQFFPAKVNLAMLLNGQGEKREAEKLLREVVTDTPENAEAAYSLGLLLAELKEYEESARFLGIAADGMVAHSRARYNYGLALLKIGKVAEAETQLKQVLEREPLNRDYFVALANIYLANQQPEKAVELARAMLSNYPDHPAAHELLKLMGFKTLRR